MPRRVMDLFACWRTQCGSPQSEAIWNKIPPYLMWYIWRERNDQNFEESEGMVVELNAFFFYTLYQWMATYECFYISSLYEFFILFYIYIYIFFLKKKNTEVKLKSFFELHILRKNSSFLTN